MAQNPPTNKELVVQLRQLITQVANLAMTVNKLATGGGANPPPAAQQAAAACFGIAPGVTWCNNLIDFSMKNELVLNKAGIEPLLATFNLKVEQFVIVEEGFMNKIRSESRD